MSAPNEFVKLPSVLKTYSSSNKHALVVTSAVLFDHQLTSPWFAPTPIAPASADNFQVPTGVEVFVSPPPTAGSVNFSALNLILSI